MADQSNNHNTALNNVPSAGAVKYDEEIYCTRLQRQTEFASQLIADAGAQDISLDDNPDLTNLLYRLEIYNSIPKEIGEIISQILDWIWELNDASDNH